MTFNTHNHNNTYLPRTCLVFSFGGSLLYFLGLEPADTRIIGIKRANVNGDVFIVVTRAFLTMKVLFITIQTQGDPENCSLINNIIFHLKDVRYFMLIIIHQFCGIDLNHYFFLVFLLSLILFIKVT